MKIVLWGNGNRGVSCLKLLLKTEHEILCVVADPRTENQWYDSVAQLGRKSNLDIIQPSDPNDEQTERYLRKLEPDLFVLAGYGRIMKENIIYIPNIMCINLHAGKLPDYRGSSPMNWALINGESEFSLSMIRLDKGVDTGDVLLTKKFEIKDNYTIRDIHRIANENFPRLLKELLDKIEKGDHTEEKQDNRKARYYHLRRPDDGFIVWELSTALEIHNRIRALTEPYPCAFAYLKRRKVRLIESELTKKCYIGEPARIYRISKEKGLLVGTKDVCLWIKKAGFVDDGEPIHNHVHKYDRFLRLSDLFAKLYD